MSAASGYAQGAFCWTELGTSDAEAARKFYGEVIGWEMAEAQQPSGDIYTLARVQGGDAAGIYTLMPDMVERGVPPHWLTYAWADDVDALVARGQELGGAVVAPPMDIPGVGRIAVLADPAGAAFGLFQGVEHRGAAQIGTVQGTMCWTELATRDCDRAGKFYTDLFGWDAQVNDMGGMQYTMFTLGQTTVGGMMAITPEMGEAPSHWLQYFTVDDCDATCEKAKALGANICVGPRDIPGVGRIAVLTDPQGATVAIYTSAAPAQ